MGQVGLRRCNPNRTADSTSLCQRGHTGRETQLEKESRIIGCESVRCCVFKTLVGDWLVFHLVVLSGGF